MTRRGGLLTTLESESLARTGPGSKPKRQPRALPYCPASSLAVIKPTLSIPEARMMSMARATSWNWMSLSPLTNATFSARSLKICSMRGPRPSQLESSLLILTLLSLVTCTTTVLFSRSWFCCWFGFGCGTSVSKPLGVSGVMTMKIIKSTSKISMSGTTFISAIAPPLFSPTCIPIASLLSAHPCEGRSLGAAPGGSQRGNGTYCENQRQRMEPSKRSETSVTTGGRRRRSSPFRALGQKPQLVHTGGTYLIDDGNHVAILGACIAFEIDRFV